MDSKKRFNGIRLQIEVAKPNITLVNSYKRIRLGKEEIVRAHFRRTGITEGMIVRISTR